LNNLLLGLLMKAGGLRGPGRGFWRSSLREKVSAAVRLPSNLHLCVHGSTAFGSDFGELSRAEAQARRELAEVRGSVWCFFILIDSRYFAL